MGLSDRFISYLPSSIVERIDAMPLGRRLSRSVFWTAGGAIAARVLRVPVSIILARQMGKITYGEFGIATASLDLFGVFASLALGMTATKYVAELRVKDPERAGNIIGLSTFVSAVAGAIFATLLFCQAPWLARHALAAPQLAPVLRIGAFVLFFSSMNGAQTGALYGFEAFRVTARLQAIMGVLDVPFLLGGYFLDGLDGVLYGMASSRLAIWILMRRALFTEMRRHQIPVLFGRWRQELPVLWRFSVPAALAGILVVPVNWACSAILVNRPAGYAAMGAYSAANQWYSTLLLLPALLGSGVFPVLSERMGNGDASSTASVLKTMMKLAAAVVVPFAVCLSLLAPFVMRVYGNSYSDEWPTLIAVVWTAAIAAILVPVGDVIAASGRMWVGAALNSAWAVIYILATVILVRFGSLGFATSRLIAYGFHALWSSGFAYLIITKRQRASSSQTLSGEIEVASAL